MLAFFIPACFNLPAVDVVVLLGLLVVKSPGSRQRLVVVVMFFMAMRNLPPTTRNLYHAASVEVIAA